jgi:RNA polymerase sigma-70 factor (ECF subfamily)
VPCGTSQEEKRLFSIAKKKENFVPQDNESPKNSGLFLPTDWKQIQSLKEAPASERLTFLEVLAKKYWTPIFQYLRIKGYDEFEAQDLAQDFFAHALNTQLFSKADQRQGRFRNFLLKSLNNFLANKYRRESAQKRRPKEGIISLDGLAELGYFQPKSVVDNETPETIFHKAWLREVVRNALQNLENDFSSTGKSTHFILFRSRVVSPELDGEQPPSLQIQARELGLEYKEAANQILTAKRAFLRILEKEVRVYTRSEQEASEEKTDVLKLFNLEALA